jgi:hypothetical protein
MSAPLPRYGVTREPVPTTPVPPRATLLARPELLRTIADAAAVAAPRETGGPLIGRVQQSWDGEKLAPLVSIFGTVPPGPALDGRRGSVSLGAGNDGERAASALRWLRETSGLAI